MAIPPRAAYVVTDAVAAARSFRGQMGYLQNLGYEVTVIGSPGESLDRVATQDGVEVVPLQMQREIRPANDARALWEMKKALKKINPSLVHAATPKASLLSMMASRWLRIPIRVYGLWGLRLETTKGLKRNILWSTEWMTSKCANRVVSVGEGLKRAYAEHKIASAHKIEVIGKGSANGIDLEKFSRSMHNQQVADQIREDLKIDPDTKVIGYVGRLTKDKGIEDLYHSFCQLKLKHPKLHLLLVGGHEAGDPVDPEIARKLDEDPCITITNFINETAPYYTLIDIFAFPSYREGLPNVLLEASSASLPIVASNCTGNEDIVEHEWTGQVVDVGSITQLTEAINNYLESPMRCAEHGMHARQMMEKYFDHKVFWSMVADAYAQYASAIDPSANWPVESIPVEERKVA